MIAGTSDIFAIESGITETYERLSLRALGYFVIYVGGIRYGVYKTDATMLANSFDEVGKRIADRGRHTCSFADETDPAQIADAVTRALYKEGQDEDLLLGVDRREVRHLLTSRDLLWAPDGDRAFDDRSFVLQFDVLDRVRLIAYKRTSGLLYDPNTVRDVWLAEDDFYNILKEWYDSFHTDWRLSAKIAG